MELKSDEVQSLVNNPGESLGVELKRWIDPTTDEGIAKIAKACMAMRNNNGGFVVIGFDNETRQPDQNRPADVQGSFHFDKIQAIVSRFASEVFEVAVKFGSRDGQDFPVICVPSGIRTPIAAKSALRAPDGTQIKENQVYVRSLNANGTASTTEAKWQDWGKLVAICMDTWLLASGCFGYLVTWLLFSFFPPTPSARRHLGTPALEHSSLIPSPSSHFFPFPPAPLYAILPQYDA